MRTEHGGPDEPTQLARGLGRDTLRIERIETVAVRAPLARRFEGSAYSMVNRATIITRLFTADGVVAEVYNGDTDVEQPIIVDIIHDELAPRVLGRSATDPEGAWAAMEPSTNDILRDRGLALQAIACVDTAIWDALARALEAPLHRVWGSVTDSLPMSVIGGYYHLDADQTRRVVADYATRFAGMKFKVGGRSPAEDAERVRWRPRGGRSRLRRSWSMPTRATSAPRPWSSAGAWPSWTSAGSRSPAAGRTTGAGCATCATRPVCRSRPARAR